MVKRLHWRFRRAHHPRIFKATQCNKLRTSEAGALALLGVPPAVRTNCARRQGINNRIEKFDDPLRKRTARTKEMGALVFVTFGRDAKNLRGARHPQVSKL
jgi:transposase-like protein